MWKTNEVASMSIYIACHDFIAFGAALKLHAFFCIQDHVSRTSPSSGQATTNSLLRHLDLPACHSEAALYGHNPVGSVSRVICAILHALVDMT
jgi:hypothetical protein